MAPVRHTAVGSASGRDGAPGPAGEPSEARILGLRTDAWILLAAVAAPVATAAALVPGRGHLDTGDDALILVLVIVAVASTGRRLAAAAAALVSALSFDVFLTRPYGSFRITQARDLTTEILLLAVGLAVGELAARGRSHRRAATLSHHQMSLLHSVTELAATGREPRQIVDAATEGIHELLFLRQCRFTQRDPGPVTARIAPDGEVLVGAEHWSTDDLGLPTRSVDLPVRGNGWLLGHFILTPTPGKPVSHDRLLVAVAVADQVGSALAAEHPSPLARS